LVAQDVVAAGPQAIRERFAALQAEGVGVAVVDAVSNEDLMLIGQALAGMPLVTAGSGIAIGLPQNWPQLQARGADVRADALPPARGAQAVVSGSCSVATNAQVLHFKQSGRPSLAIDPLAIAAGEDVAAQALAWAEPLLASGPVLFYATAEPSAVRAVQEKLGVARAGEMVEHTLSRIAAGLVQRGVRQLLVAGGETSGAVVQALGVQRMAIGPQIDPGVPWTSVDTPLCPGEQVHVALKSGNFGSTDFFTKAFAQLSSMP
ncbi:MAG: four-carbon acid sugar kinase family protein, partial [Burkholderiaceae bacterium]|nr:four-carbon acid sugar kinase family protein [Burkholderiaceae bacterium]